MGVPPNTLFDAPTSECSLHPHWHRASEGYVLKMIANVAEKTDVEVVRDESTDLRKDTNPVVTSGYGETGFRKLDEESPVSGTDESEEAEEAKDVLRDDYH